MEFDLGGRIIKTIACPGYTPGQIAFLDESSRSLFCGDALNCNLGYGGMPGKPIDWEHVTSVERWKVWKPLPPRRIPMTASTTATTTIARSARRWTKACCPMR